MNEFSEFFLNIVTYCLIGIGCLLWLYGVVPGSVERYLAIRKRGVEAVGAISTFLAAALAVLPVYIPPIAKEPYWYSRYITAPAFIILIVATYLLIRKGRAVHVPPLLQAVAILALAANLFRMYA